ncbi:TPA: hypothetical protein ACE7IG_001637 [Neisseria gonorrhoeae]|uniref:hypothetical protein n=1 Tax=Neisseria gonorrhoeae TaxID=485 RepID=UPI0035C4A0F9
MLPTRSVSSLLLGEYLEFEENGTKITAEIGSAWHFLDAACRISINGKYYADNRISINGKYYAGNRIVWFAKKAES